MTNDEFRAFVKARGFKPNMNRWCIRNNVVRSHTHEFLNGKRPAAPRDLLAALGFQRDIVPLDTTRTTMKGTNP